MIRALVDALEVKSIGGEVQIAHSIGSAFCRVATVRPKRGYEPEALMLLSSIDIHELPAADPCGICLQHLERDHGNSTQTRNNRLAAIHSLSAYLALHHQRVLAISPTRNQRNLVTYLTEPEADALLAAIDQRERRRRVVVGVSGRCCRRAAPVAACSSRHDPRRFQSWSTED